MTSTLQKLKEQIKVKEQELSDLKAALRVFESLEIDEPISPRNESALTAKKPAPLTDTGDIDFDKLDLPVKIASDKPTIPSMTKDVVSKFGGKEFTVNHAYAALIQLGKVDEGKHVKNRISMAVRKLADAGYLTKTYKGVGNEPHKYQVASKQVSFLKPISSEQNNKAEDA